MRKKPTQRKNAAHSSSKYTRQGITFSGYNKPKMTPNHPTKKAVVLAKEGEQVKLIRFGAQGYGHNYSSAARSSFKSRHSKNIARGKLSAAYWADRFLWSGKGGSVRKPPKGRKGKY